MLRPATPQDRAALAVLARLPDIARTLATNAVDSLHEDTLLAIDDDEGALAGGVRWALVNRRSRIADIRTLIIDPRRSGRGLATRTVRVLTRGLVEEHGFHRVEAEVYGFNHAAQRVFERAGFTREGMRRSAYDRHGAWQDGVRYGLLADELPPV